MIIWRLIGRIGYLICLIPLALLLSKTDRTRVIVRCGNEVLLVKSWLGSGAWDLPGGGLHRGEDKVAGGIREVAEELGFKLDTANLMTTEPFYSALVRYTAHYVFASVSKKPELRFQKIEIVKAQWFSKEDIDGLSMNQLLKDKVVESFSAPTE